MASKVLNIKLSNGREMPMLGLGTYARKAEYGQYQQAVEDAIDIGYRHIDTASCYNNEEAVGQGIQNKIKQGVVTREDLFVTTKEKGLANLKVTCPQELCKEAEQGKKFAAQVECKTPVLKYDKHPFLFKLILWNDRHAEKDVISAIKDSLARLKLDYLDLYLIHWPVSVSVDGKDTGIDYIETWKGMEEVLKLNLTRSIGVSNFNQDQLERLLQNCSVKPVCNQFEINPTLTQHALVDFCKSQSVAPVAYTPLGLISEARPEFIGKDVIKTDPKLGELAQKYSKTRAQIALRYLIQRGIPALPKSFTKSRLEENLNIFDFELTEADMKIVESYNIDHRCVPGTSLKEYKYFPFVKV